MPQPAQTLADTRELITRDEHKWPAASRRQMLNALDRLARLTTTELAQLPADETAVCGVIDGSLNWRRHGFKTVAAFRDFRSRVARAVRETNRSGVLRFTKGDQWLPEWQQVREELKSAIARGDEKASTLRALTHLAGFANSRGVTPAQVDSDLLAALLAEHARNRAITDAAKVRVTDFARKAIDAARAWNRLVENRAARPWLTTLPNTVLDWPGRAQRVNPPLSAYPETFQTDVAAYLATLGAESGVAASGDDDEFGSIPEYAVSYEAWDAVHGDDVVLTDVYLPDDPTHSPLPVGASKRDSPCSAATIANRRHVITQLAGAAVRRGIKQINDVTRLRDICTAPALKALLVDYKARQSAKPDSGRRTETASRYMLAETVCGIAETWCGAPAGYVAEMRKKLRNQTRTQSCGSMSQNRRLALQQFDQAWALSTWFDEPIRLFQAAEKRRKAGKPLRGQDIADVEAAILCRVLMILPVRLANLATLRFKGSRPSLQMANHAGETSWLFWQPDEVKNRRFLRAEIDRQTERMIRCYLAHWRPQYLAANPEVPDSDFLFPGRCGSDRRGWGHRCLPGTSKMIAKRMRAVGLEMTPHVARHLAATIMVTDDARHVATAAELLGISEAIVRKFYLENRSAQASAALREIVAKNNPKIRRDWID